MIVQNLSIIEGEELTKRTERTARGVENLHAKVFENLRTPSRNCPYPAFVDDCPQPFLNPLAALSVLFVNYF